MDRPYSNVVRRTLGTARSRRQILGTAVSGTIGGVGATLISRGFGGGLLEGGLAPSVRAQTNMVSIVDTADGFAFEPMATQVLAGSEVTWTNNSSGPHTVTSDAAGGPLDSPTINPGETFSHSFDTIGAFKYHCAIHPSMRGRVLVVPPIEAYVRMSVHDLTPAELDAYAAGVKAMQDRDEMDPTSWWYQANMHGTTEAVTDDTPGWNSCQHASWFFLPWHRMYLYFFEKILRDTAPSSQFALPYWDYSVPAQRVLPRALFTPTDAAGNPNPLFLSPRSGKVSGDVPLTAVDDFTFLQDAPFANTPTMMSFSHVAGGASFGGQQMEITPDEDGHFGPGYGQLERTPHNPVHGFVGGRMGAVDTAAQDPIFWLHHANIDRLWERWLILGNIRKNPEEDIWRETKFVFFDKDGDEIEMSGAEILNTISDLGYLYLDPELFPAGSPEAAAATPIVVSPDEAGPPVVLAEAESGIELGSEATTVPVAVEPEAREALATIGAPLEGPGPGPSAVLTLQGVRGEGIPGVAFQVYINVAEGQELDINSDNFVGVVDLFGQQPEERHGAPASSQSFDITRNLRALNLPATELQQLRLTFVPYQLAPVLLVDGTPEAGPPEGPQGTLATIEGVVISSQ